MFEFTFSFEGANTDNHEVDLYDVASAMIGFQRSLALTTHLVLNGKVITQSPALRNASIFAELPEEGSWKIPAKIVLYGTLAYHLSTAPKETPLGHLMYSAYDYVIKESLGFHVDYDKSLGEQYEDLTNEEQEDIPVLRQSQFDSVIEKCENSIIEMHRPIVKSNTATKAKLFCNTFDKPIKAPLSPKTYEYIKHTETADKAVKVVGKVTSYNINTFKGRIYNPKEKRPITFILAEEARTSLAVSLIAESLSKNAADPDGVLENSEISFVAYKNQSRSGRLKSYYVVSVSPLEG